MAEINIKNLEQNITTIESKIFMLGFDYTIVAGEVMEALNKLYPVSGNQQKQIKRLIATEKILGGLYQGLSKMGNYKNG